MITSETITVTVPILCVLWFKIDSDSFSVILQLLKTLTCVGYVTVYLQYTTYILIFFTLSWVTKMYSNYSFARMLVCTYIALSLNLTVDTFKVTALNLIRGSRDFSWVLEKIKIFYIKKERTRVHYGRFLLWVPWRQSKCYCQRGWLLESMTSYLKYNQKSHFNLTCTCVNQEQLTCK